MALTFIASAGNSNDASATTLDCTASLNVAAGDLLVAFATNEGGSTTINFAKDSGSPANTFTVDAADAISNSVEGQIGYVLSAAADATATIRATWGAARTFRRLVVMQFRPSGTVSKDTSTDSTGTGTSSTSGNITTTGTDEVVLGVSGLFNAGATTSEQINSVAADGVTRQSATSMWYRIVTATLTGDASDTQAISDAWICGIIAFKAPSPTINTQPQNATCYVTQTANFTITATTSGGTLHYQWKDDGSNVGTDSSSYTTAAAVSGDNGAQITCVVTDDNGSTTSAAATWTVLPVSSIAWITA